MPLPATTPVRHENHRIAGPSPRNMDSTEAAQSMPPLKTYIVEDSQVIRENLIATLEELVPVEVVGTAEDEVSAVQWLQRPGRQVDLVIIDIFLKGGSGLGVLRAIDGSRGTDGQTPKRVVLSNFATQDMRRKCLELGADRVFDKSNDIDALIQYCGRLADGLGGDGTSGLGALS